MKVLLDIKEEKVPFIMELLKNFKFVKTKKLTKKKDIRKDIKEAVKELNLVLAGKKQARDAKELLDEL